MPARARSCCLFILLLPPARSLPLASPALWPRLSPAGPSPAGSKETDVHKQNGCHGCCSTHRAGSPKQDSMGYSGSLRNRPLLDAHPAMVSALGVILSSSHTQALNKSGSLFHCGMYTHTIKAPLHPFHSSLGNMLGFLSPSSFYPSFSAKLQLPKLQYFSTHSSNHDGSLSSTFCFGLLSLLWTFSDNPNHGNNFPFTIHPVPSFHICS